MARLGKNIVKLAGLVVSAMLGLTLLIVIIVIACIKRESVFRGIKDV